MPVSTTHVITSSILGVGLSKRLTAVNWNVAYRILWAWVLTIPASAVVAFISFVSLCPFVGQ
jgi:PiT family inorganic phosphate transporter